MVWLQVRSRVEPGRFPVVPDGRGTVGSKSREDYRVNTPGGNVQILTGPRIQRRGRRPRQPQKPKSMRSTSKPGRGVVMSTPVPSVSKSNSTWKRKKSQSSLFRSEISGVKP